jgi:hypothetical protein
MINIFMCLYDMQPQSHILHNGTVHEKDEH